MKDNLKFAVALLAGAAFGFASAYLVQRFEVLYLGFEGVGYHDHAVKASFFHRW